VEYIYCNKFTNNGKRRELKHLAVSFSSLHTVSLLSFCNSSVLPCDLELVPCLLP
jgi:hypothetical protein